MKNNAIFNNNKWALYCAAFLIGITGMIGPLSSTHMAKNGASNLSIGIISSLYFVFSAATSILIAKKLQGKNIIYFINSGLFLTACSDVIFPFYKNIYFWGPMMSLMGIGMSFSFVGLQTSLQNLTDSKSRALITGVYSFFFATGFILGTVAGSRLYDYNPFSLYLMGAIITCLTIVIIQIRLRNKITSPFQPDIEITQKEHFGLQGAFVYGFTETTLVSLYPTFLIATHYNASNVGMALGIFVTGNMAGTLPVTFLADKFGKRRIFVLCALFSIFSILGILMINDYLIKLLFSFVCGFLIGPINPISLALSVEGLKENEMSKGTSYFTFMYSIGCAAGPFISALTMKIFGNIHIFSTSILLFLIIIIQGLIIRKKENICPVVNSAKFNQTYKFINMEEYYGNQKK
jgi:MFS family permease